MAAIAMAAQLWQAISQLCNCYKAFYTSFTYLLKVDKHDVVYLDKELRHE